MPARKKPLASPLGLPNATLEDQINAWGVTRRAIADRCRIKAVHALKKEGEKVRKALFAGELEFICSLAANPFHLISSGKCETGDPRTVARSDLDTEKSRRFAYLLFREPRAVSVALAAAVRESLRISNTAIWQIRLAARALYFIKNGSPKSIREPIDYQSISDFTQKISGFVPSKSLIDSALRAERASEVQQSKLQESSPSRKKSKKK